MELFDKKDVYLEFSTYADDTVCLEAFSMEDGFINVLDDNFHCDELCGHNRIAVLKTNDHIFNFLIDNDVCNFKGIYPRTITDLDTREEETWYYSILDVIEENKWKFEKARLYKGNCKICGREVLRDDMEEINDVAGVFVARICNDPKCRAEIETYPCMREDFYQDGMTAAGEWL